MYSYMDTENVNLTPSQIRLLGLLMAEWYLQEGDAPAKEVVKELE